jgi:hypothetical protein
MSPRFPKVVCNDTAEIQSDDVFAWVIQALSLDEATDLIGLLSKRKLDHHALVPRA